MNKIQKLLAKLSQSDLKKIQSILVKLETDNTKGLEIKKLSGHKDIYRIRSGSFRIILQKINNEYRLVNISKRDENTYKF